jgi:hypothetical protein
MRRVERPKKRMIPHEYLGEVGKEVFSKAHEKTNDRSGGLPKKPIIDAKVIKKKDMNRTHPGGPVSSRAIGRGD